MLLDFGHNLISGSYSNFENVIAHGGMFVLVLWFGLANGRRHSGPEEMLQQQFLL